MAYGKAPNTNYLGSEYKGNYVWSAAMNLAWNHFRDQYIQEEVKLVPPDSLLKYNLFRLNNPPVGESDLDIASYYIGSGYGKSAQKRINKERKQKFPASTFPELDLQIDDEDVLCYAYFSKNLEYGKKFKKSGLMFMGEPVQGFSPNDYYTGEEDNLDGHYAMPARMHSNDVIRIIHYENDDKFILAIQLKDPSDQLFLAKGYPMTSPDVVVDSLRAMVTVLSEPSIVIGNGMDDLDYFVAPMLHLDIKNTYKDLLGKRIANENLNNYMIVAMEEWIKFRMDEKGIAPEADAYIDGAGAAGPPKQLVLDKPYWVIMKRYNSANPYFILGVRNSGLMKKYEHSRGR